MACQLGQSDPRSASLGLRPVVATLPPCDKDSARWWQRGADQTALDLPELRPFPPREPIMAIPQSSYIRS